MIILLGDVCNDYVLASILTIIRRALNLLQIVAPILLILAATIQFVKLVLNPDDDKKSMKKIYNSFFSALIIFFIPMVINLTMNIINEYGDVGVEDGENTHSLNIAVCWKEAKRTQNVMDSVRENGGSSSSTISKERADKRSKLGSTSYSESKPAHNSDKGSSSASSSNRNTKGDQVIAYARQFLGNPYVWGGESLTNGADCSGFVKAVYAHFGVDLPHNDAAQAQMGTAVNGIENARAGDIIRYDGHVALFMGDGMQIIHASNRRTGITTNDRADYRPILAIRRIFND